MRVNSHVGYVRYWHKADMTIRAANIRFGGPKWVCAVQALIRCPNGGNLRLNPTQPTNLSAGCAAARLRVGVSMQCIALASAKNAPIDTEN
jgi:hypothetical protein